MKYEKNEAWRLQTGLLAGAMASAAGGDPGAAAAALRGLAGRLDEAP